MLNDSSMSEIECASQISDFLYMIDGQTEFWDILKVIMDKNHYGDIGSRVLHISDMAGAYESKANELLTVTGFSMLGTVMMKKRDRQLSSAKTYFKLGKFKQYCDLMMQIGEH